MGVCHPFRLEREKGAVMSMVRMIVGGVDTHADQHVAAAIDANGGIVGVESFPADHAGFEALFGWLVSHGEVARVGGKRCRNLVEHEQLRILLIARRSARQQRIATLNQLRHVIFTGPDEVRARFKDRYKTGLVSEVAKLRPRNGSDPVLYTTLVTMRGLARRIGMLNTEVRDLDRMLSELVNATAPSLVALYGAGVDTAASLMVTAGDNPDRIGTEASWAHLCGVTPIPASSGRTTRYRLNRGGDRHANAALYRIVLTRMSSDPRTRDYVQRRRTEGLSNREIMRCLKRYVETLRREGDVQTPPTHDMKIWVGA
jgi:transposase